MKGVQGGTRDQCGLIGDPQGPNGIERVGEYDSLLTDQQLFDIVAIPASKMSRSGSHLTNNRREHRLPCFPAGSGRQVHTASPISVLLLRGHSLAGGGCRTEALLALQAVPLSWAHRSGSGSGW